MYCARASRVLAEVAGIRMLASTLKPLWVHSSMFFASRSFRSLRSRKKAIPPLTEATAHLLEIHSGDVDETSLCVEVSLEEQAVPVGVPPTEGSRRLEYEDTGAAQRAAGGLGNEVAYQGVDEATDLAVQPLVVAEEDAQDLGQGEDELPVRQSEQKPLVHVLAQEQRPLLRARGAEMEDGATEGPEVLRLTPGFVHRMRATPRR